MSEIVEIDIDALYSAWRTFMLANSKAKHFGMFNDQSQAEFPYSNLMVIGMPTAAADLENTEHTVNLSVQVDNYIDSMKILDLYGMDKACWMFFQHLGFRKMGDSVPTQIQNSNVKRITSRYTIENFTGTYLNELPSGD